MNKHTFKSANLSNVVLRSIEEVRSDREERVNDHALPVAVDPGAVPGVVGPGEHLVPEIRHCAVTRTRQRHLSIKLKPFIYIRGRYVTFLLPSKAQEIF